MWTPKRILMLAFGLTVFVTGYLVYGRFLGGIDGLPPLPEIWRFAAGEEGPPPVTSRYENPLLGKIRDAWGPACPELTRPFKLAMNGKSTVLTAENCFVEDGKLRLEPLSVAMFGKKILQPDGKTAWPVINTIRCQKAVITFDRPLEKYTDANNRKIVAAELTGDIQVCNNNGTPEKFDDINVYVHNGPLYYDEARHLIWTHDAVHLIDARKQPPMDVRGQGLEMVLAVEAPAPPPGATAVHKGKGDTIAGVKRVVLQSNVEMHLYVDAHSGFPAGQTAPAEPVSPPFVGPPAPAAPPEKAHVTIKSPGRFQYDLFKDYDLAHFDVAVGDGSALLKSSSPQDVTVTRLNERLNLIDQLICEHLDLKLTREEPKPVPGAKPAPAAEPAGDSNQHIETVHATGRTVTITSDGEKLTAQCGDLFYDARTKLTILKGNPEVFALKEDSTLHARELHLQEQPAPAPTGKPFQQITAYGPGQFELIDKDADEKKPTNPGDKAAAPKKPLRAYWDHTLVSTKDGPFDLLILTKSAKFVDEEHNQTLQGDTLKVWLGGPDKPASAVAQPAQSTTQQARRPHHLEALGNVNARSSEMIIHDTSRLVVWFRDDETPKSLPHVIPSPSAPPPVTPPPHEVGKQPVPTPGAPPEKKEAPPRPIDLSARSVEARVLRSEVKNTLETVRCEGMVKVLQDPATPEEKGVDIEGNKLAMDYHEDGNTLVVTSDGVTGDRDPDIAYLQMDKMVIFGQDIHIDQPTNKAWVIGPGAMTMESKTSFSGEQLQKAVPLTIHWEGSMLFNGNYAEFHTNIQGEQDNARLACDSLVVYFDRRISLKEGNKTDQPAQVQHLLCDRAVRVEDSVYEGKERTKFQQITSSSLVMETIQPDPDDPRRPRPASDGNEINASGLGEVRILQKGGVDPLAPPPTQPPGTVPAPGKAPPKVQPGAKPQDDTMKMTYVSYGERMYANSKKNYAKFLGNVRVLNFPCNEPHVEINLDLMLDKMPEGAMYLRSDMLEVWTHTTNNRKYSEMYATGRALVQSSEYWGRAATIRFDEAKDQIIFDGGKEGKATLYKIVAKGQDPQKVEGKKIIYLRSTGQCWVDQASSLQGIGSGGPRAPGK